MLHLNASQSTLVAGICTRVARLEVYSSSNVEKNTRLHKFAIDQLSDDLTTPSYYAYKDLLISFFLLFQNALWTKVANDAVTTESDLVDASKEFFENIW